MALPLQVCLATSIPGPLGSTGPAGANGTNGISASTHLTADFTMPNQGVDGNASVTDSSVFSFGEVILLAVAGYMRVDGIPDGSTLTLRNLRDDGVQDYPDNAASGTIVPSGALLSPAGPQGPQGSIGGIVAGGDLVGNYPNPTLIPVGAAGLYGDSTHVAQVTTDAKGRVTNVTIVPIAFPASGAPSGAAGGSLSGTYPNPGLSITGISPAAYGNGVSWPIFTVNAEGRITAISTVTPLILPRRGLLGSLIGANFALTTDQPISIASTRYRVTDVIIERTTPPLAPFNTTGAIYTGAAKSGNQVAGGTWSDASLNSTESWFSLPLSAFAQSHVFTGNIIYMSLTLAQIAAGTGNIWVMGDTYG